MFVGIWLAEFGGVYSLAASAISSAEYRYGLKLSSLHGINLKTANVVNLNRAAYLYLDSDTMLDTTHMFDYSLTGTAGEGCITLIPVITKQWNYTTDKVYLWAACMDDFSRTCCSKDTVDNNCCYRWSDPLNAAFNTNFFLSKVYLDYQAAVTAAVQQYPIGPAPSAEGDGSVAVEWTSDPTERFQTRSLALTYGLLGIALCLLPVDVWMLCHWIVIKCGASGVPYSLF